MLVLPPLSGFLFAKLLMADSHIEMEALSTTILTPRTAV